MSASRKLISIFDTEEAARSVYRQTLACQFDLEFPESIGELTRKPELVIAAPDLQLQRKLADLGHAYVLAAKGTNLDFLRECIALGAIEWIPKPLRSVELAIRIDNAMTKVTGETVETLPGAIDGKAVTGLTFKERQLLAKLVSSSNRMVERQDLFAALWNDVAVNRKTLDVHLFNLRKKLRVIGYDVHFESNTYRLKNLNP